MYSFRALADSTNRRFDQSPYERVARVEKQCKFSIYVHLKELYVLFGASAIATAELGCLQPKHVFFTSTNVTHARSFGFACTSHLVGYHWTAFGTDDIMTPQRIVACVISSYSHKSLRDRSRRPKKCRLARSSKLRAIVSRKLQLDWSPQQIAGWLKLKYPDNAALHISHETIYRTLFVQSRGALKKELLAHLRSSRIMRRPTNASLKGKGRGKIIEAVSIHERPAEAAGRAVPSH